MAKGAEGEKQEGERGGGESVEECDKIEWRRSAIEEGGVTTISSQGRSPKQPLPWIGLHDPLHGRKACPEFIAFDLGGDQLNQRADPSATCLERESEPRLTSHHV